MERLRFEVAKQWNDFYKNIKKSFGYNEFVVFLMDNAEILDSLTDFTADSLSGLGMDVTPIDYTSFENIATSIKDELIEAFKGKPLPMAYSDEFLNVNMLKCEHINADYINKYLVMDLFHSVQVLGMEQFDKLLRRLVIVHTFFYFDNSGKDLTDEVFIQINKILKSVLLKYVPSLKDEYNRLIDSTKDFTLFGEDFICSGNLEAKALAGIDLEAHNDLVVKLGKDKLKQTHIRPAIGHYKDRALCLI